MDHRAWISAERMIVVAMLKRIKPNHARLGMFIEAIEGAWADHPFWRNQFRLDRTKDVEKLKSSNATAVVINTGKGFGCRPSLCHEGSNRNR